MPPKDHELFHRSKKQPYPPAMTKLSSLRYFSLWNQSVAKLIELIRPDVPLSLSLRLCLPPSLRPSGTLSVLSAFRVGRPSPRCRALLVRKQSLSGQTYTTAWTTTRPWRTSTSRRRTRSPWSWCSTTRTTLLIYYDLLYCNILLHYYTMLYYDIIQHTMIYYHKLQGLHGHHRDGLHQRPLLADGPGPPAPQPS